MVQDTFPYYTLITKTVTKTIRNKHPPLSSHIVQFTHPGHYWFDLKSNNYGNIIHATHPNAIEGINAPLLSFTAADALK